jgi:hypothetical protein
MEVAGGLEIQGSMRAADELRKRSSRSYRQAGRHKKRPALPRIYGFPGRRRVAVEGVSETDFRDVKSESRAANPAPVFVATVGRAGSPKSEALYYHY